MNYQSAKKLKPADFKRRFGIRMRTFKAMVKAVKSCEDNSSHKRGAKPKLTPEDKILVALEYWREYRTYFHISTDWGVSESTVCRIVHQIESRLMQSGQFRLPGKKTLFQGFGHPEVIVMDVTETPIERPKKDQKQFYSGKKKRHTLKVQLIVERETRQVICTFFGRGRCHDFALFKASGIKFHPETESLQDSGYQGIHDFHKNSFIPKKKPKQGQLSSLEKEYNRALSRERVVIEHINRSLKIFKIFSERYRNRRRRYGLRCNLLAAIYNYELPRVS